MEKKILKVHKTEIVNGKQPIVLQGVNLGGWLLMEGYILHSLNVAEQIFKRNFTAALGEQALRNFEKTFRDHFVTEKDFARIASWGCNCVRVPFHYRLIEAAPYHYHAAGLAYLDRVLKWAAKYRLWIILDLHAAPGSQNYDWHSDSGGKADLWNKKEYQSRSVALWRYLAQHFHGAEWLAGYDVLNEAVVKDARLLNDFYRRVISAIREVDRNHIIFIEGNTWAQDLDVLEPFSDGNLALSIHYYQPLEFTFNLVPQLHYPLEHQKKVFNHQTMATILDHSIRAARKQYRPLYVGEFGVNARQGLYGEDKWLKDVLHCFSQAGVHWTYWTYKAVKNAIFPDGILSYRGNPPWINRQGPYLGWDNYVECWPKLRKEMVKSWLSENFHENTEVLAVLRHYWGKNI
jgi:endoglucanase